RIVHHDTTSIECELASTLLLGCIVGVFIHSRCTPRIASEALHLAYSGDLHTRILGAGRRKVYSRCWMAYIKSLLQAASLYNMVE
ncbi:MAG: hypothetical protein ACFFD9_08235, partial [Candidatus Thorarchaeota archaeon]